MFDVIVLNRNLGEICDRLVDRLEALGLDDGEIIVVDSSTVDALASDRATVRVASDEALEHGLRFNRGMNIGLEQRDLRGGTGEWILFLPVDTEIVRWDRQQFLANIALFPNLAAIKPLEMGSGYESMLGSHGAMLGWNFEEGPWFISSEFIRQQRALSKERAFFDNSNFRGYLTSIELAFRAYANDWCVAVSDSMVVHENESYLIERSDLIGTEPPARNYELLLEEGLTWLGQKYALSDPWVFAFLTKLLFDQFIREHPQLVNWEL